MSSDSASSSPSAQSPSQLSPHEHVHRRPHEKRSRHTKGRKHSNRTSTGGACAAASSAGTSSTGGPRKSRLHVHPPSPQLPTWPLHCDVGAAHGTVSPFAAGDDLSSASSSPSLYLAPLTPGTELLMEDTNSRLDSLDINESSSSSSSLAATGVGCSGLTESALSTQTVTDASSVSSFAAESVCGAAGAAAGGAALGTPCVLPRNNGALFHRTPVLPIVCSPDPFKRPPSAPGECHPAVPMSPSKMRRCDIPCVPELTSTLFSPLLAPRGTPRGPRSVLSKSMSSLPRPDIPAPAAAATTSTTSTSSGTDSSRKSNYDPVTYDDVTIDVPGYSGNRESMLRAISVHSAHELLTGAKPLPAGHRLLLADGRLAFEFDAGHIRGAVNITVSATRGCIREQILRVVERAHEEHQKYFVLVYCEFSSARGPRLGTALRAVERDYLAERCPGSESDFHRLTCFPHIYAIYGGYSQFFADHPDLCVPPVYVSQKDPAFAELNRRLEPVYHEQIFDATRSMSLRRSASDMAIDDAHPAEPRPAAKPVPRRLFTSSIFGAASQFDDGDDDDDDDGCCDTDDDDVAQLDDLNSSLGTPTRSLGRRCVSCVANVEGGTSSTSSSSASASNGPSPLEEDDRLNLTLDRPLRPPAFD